jgi:hypothetical protein
MKIPKFFAAGAIAVMAFVVEPTMESMTADAATEVSQPSVKKCQWVHNGRHWRFRHRGRFYNYRWRGRYYRTRVRCGGRPGRWCYRR